MNEVRSNVLYVCNVSILTAVCVQWSRDLHAQRCYSLWWLGTQRCAQHLWNVSGLFVQCQGRPQGGGGGGATGAFCPGPHGGPPEYLFKRLIYSNRAVRSKYSNRAVHFLKFFFGLQLTAWVKV